MGRIRSTTRRAPGLFVALVVALTAVVALLVVGAAVLNPFRTETVDRSGPTLVERIRELEEFTAAEAEFTQDVDLESDTRYVPDFVKGERVVAMARGSVAATVDLGELDDGAVTVSEDGTTVAVTLPAPVLQDADVEEGATRVVGPPSVESSTAWATPSPPIPSTTATCMLRPRRSSRPLPPSRAWRRGRGRTPRPG